MVIVVPDADWQARIMSLLSEQSTVDSPSFELADALPDQVIARARRKHGSAVPLAYVAVNELTALAAIHGGADEAMALPRADGAQVLVLLDRAAQRAAKRRSVEQAHSLAVRAEKLAALETVVAGVAHEINNPLAAVCLSVEYLQTALVPAMEVNALIAQRAKEGRALGVAEVQSLAARGSVSQALDSQRVLGDLLDLVDTIAAIVRDLRSYARADDKDVLELVDLPELIEQVLRIVGGELNALAHIERDYCEDIPKVLVPRSRIVQVFTNILLNAAHAIREVERPAHRVRITVRTDAEAVAVSFSDSGQGIAPEALDRIFDPFFTTKRDGRGTGLGLSISRSILLRIGGDLMVESVHGEGATFIVFIPRPEHEALREAGVRPEAPRRALPARRACVLLVEDDERLLRIYPRVLRDRFEVLTAVDGQEAIDMLGSGLVVDAIVSDLTMPGVDGEHLFRWLERERPLLARRTLFVTGAHDQASQRFLIALPNACLSKPLSSAELIAGIERVLQQYPSVPQV
jgi:two-component system NtrC family sensor kinase